MADAPSPSIDVATQPRVWLIAGPTASGKSDLALALASAMNGEIVNADALQLYADLRIISARPTPQEEHAAPHHLYGVADAGDGWSVGRWLRAVLPVLEGVAARGKPAILVGGTGLYFRALTDGLAEIPDPADAVRIAAASTFDDFGEARFRDALAQFDPTAEARIAPGDRQRLLRAYGVFWSSGKALSDWQALTQPSLPPGSWRALVVEPPRDVLYARIDARMRRMVEQGALLEAATLLSRGLDAELPAMKAVGLRELGGAAFGQVSTAVALGEAQQASRRFAKRQLTWFRNQTADWPRVESLDPATRLRQALAILTESADRGPPGPA